MKPSLSLLSRLWLSEPDADLVKVASGEAGLPQVAAAELAPAYLDLFILNVYPYGTVFLDPSGELNGPLALWTSERFAAAGYAPVELPRVGAPDHVGLCLGFAEHLARRGRPDVEFSRTAAHWIPVCALAAEAEPSAHEFYRALARATREKVLSENVSGAPPAGPEEEGLVASPEGEVRLTDVLAFLLSPARCGFFLSRGRIGHLARSIGLRLPFGTRFEVARGLFEGAGEAGAADRLIALLAEEVSAWERRYREMAARHPAWDESARAWIARLDRTRAALGAMRGIVESPPEWDYEEPMPGRQGGVAEP